MSLLSDWLKNHESDTRGQLSRFTRSVTQTWWSSDTNADNTRLWKKPLNDNKLLLRSLFCDVTHVWVSLSDLWCCFCAVCCYKNYKCTCFTLRSAGVEYFTGDEPVSSHLCRLSETAPPAGKLIALV